MGNVNSIDVKMLSAVRGAVLCSVMLGGCASASGYALYYGLLVPGLWFVIGSAVLAYGALHFVGVISETYRTVRYGLIRKA